MNYLTQQDYSKILKEVKLVSIKMIEDVSSLKFDSCVKEYNEFLKIARIFDDMNISKTFLLLHRETKELLGYMSLSSDSIKLTRDEKEMHDISKVPYAAVPALKIGKLAVNRAISDRAKRKGYGSFLINIAKVYALKLNELGVACRFLTVDADIDYDKNTPEFYVKNGFVENLSNKSRNPQHTISMRKDILV